MTLSRPLRSGLGMFSLSEFRVEYKIWKLSVNLMINCKKNQQETRFLVFNPNKKWKFTSRSTISDHIQPFRTELLEFASTNFRVAYRFWKPWLYSIINNQRPWSFRIQTWYIAVRVKLVLPWCVHHLGATGHAHHSPMLNSRHATQILNARNVLHILHISTLRTLVLLPFFYQF